MKKSTTEEIREFSLNRTKSLIAKHKGNETMAFKEWLTGKARRNRYDTRRYFELSLNDISDLCWKAIIKWRDDDSFSNFWLRERIVEKVKARKEASQ